MNSFYTHDELLSMGFAKLGSNVLISKKASLYNIHLIQIGSNVRIDDFCILSGRITLGNYVHIAAYTSLFAGEAGIDCCDFSGVSSHSSVYAITDDYSGVAMTNPMVPDKFRNVIGSKVIINRHCVIGASSVILPGVIIGEGSSVGSMSLVNKSLPEWKVCVGIPCKVLKERKKDILTLESMMQNGRIL